MDDFLVEIYRISDIRTELIEISRLVYCYNWHEVKKRINNYLSDEMVWLRDLLKQKDEDLAKTIWTEVQYAIDQVGKNASFAADLIQKRVIPKLNKILADTAHIEVVDDDNEWGFLSTESGYLTLKDITNNSYVHSMVDPMEEAKVQAERVFRINKNEYVFLGCGLGYLPFQIFKMSNESADIVVFEKSEKLVNYALQFGVLGKIEEQKLKVFVYDDILDYLHYINRRECVNHIYVPLIDREINKDEVHSIDNMLIEQSTSNYFKELFEINFWNNVKNVTNDVSYLRKNNINKEFIVVAAGPSVDAEIEYLRENKGEKTIIAVGTIFSKLINNGIEPDYVVICDPQKDTLRQISGLEDENTKLVLSVNSYWRIAEEYKGDKYLYYNYTVSDHSELYMKEKKVSIMNIGGTVTCMAIELAVYLGAKSIEMVGIDLAYPAEKSHATGTMHDNEKLDNSNYIMIDAVNGGKVRTTRLMKSYLTDVETQIRIYSNVAFYNRSKIGAYVKGVKNKLI